jgi:DNA-damage-inducible protein D
MKNELVIKTPQADFESIKKVDENGVEYWTARELVPVLGYARWQRFEEVIEKAKKACINSKQFPQDHFTGTGKMTQIGHGIVRRLDDYKLDRYACYLIAQNGDPSKPEIARAQTYFAIQTRKQEIFESLTNDDKRLFIRGEVADQNKKLFSTAKKAGVSNFGLFNNAGYKGLYDLSISEIERKKDIRKGELLDRAGSSELAANLFRITQTDDKLQKDKIIGDKKSRDTHFTIGRKVRKTIADIGGTMPEHLPVEKHIRELNKAKIKSLK